MVARLEGPVSPESRRKPISFTDAGSAGRLWIAELSAGSSALELGVVVASLLSCTTFVCVASSTAGSGATSPVATSPAATSPAAGLCRNVGDPPASLAGMFGFDPPTGVGCIGGGSAGAGCAIVGESGGETMGRRGDGGLKQRTAT